MNICIVGNGPSLLKSNLGPIIDSFDLVVRINCFFLNEDTGHRLDVHAINCQNNIRKDIRRSYGMGIRNYILVPSISQTKTNQMKSTILTYPEVTLDTINLDIVLDLKGNVPMVASTGCNLLAHFMITTDEKVTIAGFNSAIDSKKGHYDGTPGGIHKPRFEKKYITDWVDKGRVRILELEYHDHQR